jgi:cell surface protein SprA
MSLDHAYNATFHRDWRGDIDGSEHTDIERVTFGFNPLIGVNSTFKELWKGNLSGNLRYNTGTIYDLNVSAQQIVETFSQEISFTATYSRHGFRLPLFGLNLNNDADISLTFSQAKNSRRQHDPTVLATNQEGIPLSGNTRTTLEPRLHYVLSARVSSSLYYRYTRIAPDAGGSDIFGSTTNEAGVEIHLSVGSM